MSRPGILTEQLRLIIWHRGFRRLVVGTSGPCFHTNGRIAPFDGAHPEIALYTLQTTVTDWRQAGEPEGSGDHQARQPSEIFALERIEFSSDLSFTAIYFLRNASRDLA